MAITNITATFNGTALSSIAGVSVLATDPYRPPKRSINLDQLARTNRGRVSSAFYTKRDISVRIAIHGSSRNDAERILDSLLAILVGKEKELVVLQAGAARKYICTLADVPIVEAGGAYFELNLIFTCSDKYGYDTAYTTIVNATGITAASRNDNYTFDGSAPTQAPFITVYYSAVSGGTSKTVTIGNGSTGQQVSITRNWAAGDRIEIDAVGNAANGYKPTVKVNGVEVAYSGAIPEFGKGAGTLTYSDNLTTRTFNLLGYYYRRYL